MSSSPLAGKRIVLTRSRADNRELAARLTAEGARVVEVPTLRFTLVEDLRDWEEALGYRERIDTLAFTSHRTVEFFGLLSERYRVPLSSWRHARVAAIGTRTARALEAAGLPADFVGTGGGGAPFAIELVEALRLGPGNTVFLPASSLARGELQDFLLSAGLTVIAVPVYDTDSERPEKAHALLQALEAGETIDAIVFASPSALRAFLDMTGSAGEELLAREATRLVAIGETTAEAMRDRELPVAARAAKPSPDGLLAALEEALASPGSERNSA